MNSIERIIYDKIRFSPKIKNLVVRIYQFLLSIIPIKKIKSGYNIITREGYFFGFHDKSPWSSDNRYLLAHEYASDLKIPKADDIVNIGYFSSTDFMKFNKIGTTKTWNWQMGSMLQWYGDNIIFNNFEKKRHIAKIVNLQGGLVKKYDRPISAINSSLKFGLSHSFIRLQKVAPAYSYANGSEITQDDNCPKNDGIVLMDMESKESKLLFSIAEIAQYNSGNYAKDSYHYFTHCLFNPCGQRFAFYHRWVEPNNQTWTRLFTCDIDGKKLHLYNFNGVVTHLAWQDDKHLLAYGYKKGIGDHYYLLEDISDKFEIIGEEYFTSDGHPQFSPDNTTFVTDTYPDRFRRQYLITYDLDKELSKLIAVAKSPLRYNGDIRCDFHPRWDRTGKIISFDSAHTGKRSLCTVRIK